MVYDVFIHTITRMPFSRRLTARSLVEIQTLTVLLGNVNPDMSFCYISVIAKEFE